MKEKTEEELAESHIKMIKNTFLLFKSLNEELIL